MESYSEFQRRWNEYDDKQQAWGRGKYAPQPERDYATEQAERIHDEQWRPAPRDYAAEKFDEIRDDGPTEADWAEFHRWCRTQDDEDTSLLDREERH